MNIASPPPTLSPTLPLFNLQPFPSPNFLLCSTAQYSESQYLNPNIPLNGRGGGVLPITVSKSKMPAVFLLSVQLAAVVGVGLGIAAELMAWRRPGVPAFGYG
jgi:hypothetical protein